MFVGAEEVAHLATSSRPFLKEICLGTNGGGAAHRCSDWRRPQKYTMRKSRKRADSADVFPSFHLLLNRSELEIKTNKSEINLMSKT